MSKICVHTNSSSKSIVVLIWLWLMTVNVTFAQKESSIWYFGFGAGINFNASPPKALTDGAINTFEGCASACNNKGELLFYTDGLTLWNKKHQIMSNGLGLLGDMSSTQSGVITKKPESKNMYYVFTVSKEGSSTGLRYTVVDIDAKGGLGEVTLAKNISIVASTCEKISVIKHHNNIDFWIITKLFGSNAFYSYLLTKNGLNTIPVISTVGLTISSTNLNAIGYMKASQDGSRIACVNYLMDNVGVFDFDKKTGKLSRAVALETKLSNTLYGCEFSPNGKLLYVTEALNIGRIFQFNVSLPDQEDIQNSMSIVGITRNNTGAIQLAPDRKLYISMFDSYLSVINHPDSPGISCGFNREGIYLGGKKAAFGLPSFYGSVINSIRCEEACVGDSTVFELTSGNIDQVVWHFGDTSSGIANTSSKMSPKHLYNKPGKYKVIAILQQNSHFDTLQLSVIVSAVNQIDLGVDRYICPGDSIRLHANGVKGQYAWSDSSTSELLNVYKPGTYWLNLKNGRCVVQDTVVVFAKQVPHVDLGLDTSICVGQTVSFDVSTQADTYKWFNGSSDSIMVVSDSGLIWVKIEKDGCFNSDSLLITYKQTPHVELGKDTLLCDAKYLVLRSTVLADSFVWDDGSYNTSYTIDTSGLYWQTAFFDNCTATDSIRVNFEQKPKVYLRNDTNLCLGEVLPIKIDDPKVQYRWHNNTNTPQYMVKSPELIWVEATNQCGSARDSMQIRYSDCQCLIEVPNVFSPNHDNLNDGFEPVFLDCQYSSYRLSIYNRWGGKIFESNHLNQAWDGTFSGQIVPKGAYMYELTFENPNKVEYKFGTVMVLD